MRPLAKDGTPAPLRYRFDADSLTRLADTIAASVAMRSVIIGVGTLAALVTVLGIWASTTATITANESSLAMVLTLGLESNFLARIVVFLSLGVVLVAIGISFPVWAVLHFTLTGSSSIWPFDTCYALAIWAAVAMGLTLLALMTAAMAFSKWIRGVRGQIARIP